MDVTVIVKCEKCGKEGLLTGYNPKNQIGNQSKWWSNRSPVEWNGFYYKMMEAMQIPHIDSVNHVYCKGCVAKFEALEKALEDAVRRFYKTGILPDRLEYLGDQRPDSQRRPEEQEKEYR